MSKFFGYFGIKPNVTRVDLTDDEAYREFQRNQAQRHNEALQYAVQPRELLRAGSESPQFSSTRPIRHARAGRRTFTFAAEAFGTWAARAALKGDARQAYTFATQAAHFAALAMLCDPSLTAGMDPKLGQSPAPAQSSNNVSHWFREFREQTRGGDR
jgi:hypothetical protein